MRYRRFEPLGRDLSVLALGTAYLVEDGEATSFEQVMALAKDGLGDDAEGYRREFVSLVKLAQALTPKQSKAE